MNMDPSAAARSLGLPVLARWTCYSHADQDRIAALTGTLAPYRRQQEENRRFIRSYYTHPDLAAQHAQCGHSFMPFAAWLEKEREHLEQTAHNPHISKQDKDLDKFRLARVLIALQTINQKPKKGPDHD
jgi:hypothetical protein